MFLHSIKEKTVRKLYIILIAAGIMFAGCSQETGESQADIADHNETNEVIMGNSEEQEIIEYDEDAISQTLNDWMLGTDYGIEDITLDGENKNVEITISDENYAKLEQYNFDDIVVSIADVLAFYDLSGDYTLTYSNGTSTELVVREYQEGAEIEQSNDDEAETEQHVTSTVYNTGDTINLIFIHHSVGENWLNAGLNDMLNQNNIHVADTYYGWGHMGDRTDTADWPDWFNDEIMPTVYNELDTMTAYNAIEAAEGENTIIVFKSCYPNSEVGNSIEDEKEIYLSLLNYFSEHPDKMFVLITPPPMQHISNSDKTRELCNWLVDKNGWRNDYTKNNLYVFDFYNVLTDEDNHHVLSGGVEQQIVNDSSNTLRYDSGGDDHPNDEGSYKAAEELVPLLMHWFSEFTGK